VESSWLGLSRPKRFGTLYELDLFRAQESER
jgi:hypothetical protein